MALSMTESNKVEVTIYGGKPWGFTLDGGCDYFDLLIVTKVDPSGKSSKVGLEVGDVIEAVNGEICTNRREAVDFIQTSSTVLQLLIRRYSNRAALVQQCVSNARSNLCCYPRRTNLRLSKSAGDLYNIEDDRRINIADSFISTSSKPLIGAGSYSGDFSLNKRDRNHLLRSSFEEPESSTSHKSGYFVKHGRSYSSFESNRRASRKYSRAPKIRSEPAFDVYPRRHSMGYSLEVIPDSKGRNSILPRCTVLNTEGQHQISVSEDFLKRHSIATERTFVNPEFGDPSDHKNNNNKTNNISNKRASLFVERTGTDSLWMQPKTGTLGYVESGKDDTSKEADKNVFGGMADLLASVSSAQIMPPLPPARNSSMYAVHEIAQHRGVWSRNTKAVAQVNDLNLNVATSSEQSHVLVATTKQSEPAMLNAAALNKDKNESRASNCLNEWSMSEQGASKANLCDKSQSHLTAPNSSEFISKSFPNQSQFVSRPHSSADLIDEDQIFAHQPFHLMDRPHTATDMYSNASFLKQGKDHGMTPIESGLKVASHESLGDLIARSSSYTPDRVLNEKFRPDLRSTDSLQGYARSGSEEKHEFDSRQKEKTTSNKWGVSFEGLSPENNVFVESVDTKRKSRDIENEAVVGVAASSHDSVANQIAQPSARLLPNGASYSKSYQNQSSSCSLISAATQSNLSAHAINSNSSKPEGKDDRSMLNSLSTPSQPHPQSQPPPVPARDSSKSINFADYKRYPSGAAVAGNSGQPTVPVAVARKCVIVDPMSLKHLSPAKETGLNSSTYSPFHKPLPDAPSNKNILERANTSKDDKENHDSGLTAGNVPGARSSVDTTKGGTLDLSYLTAANDQQPAGQRSKNSTYVNNQTPKAIPPKFIEVKPNNQNSVPAKYIDHKCFNKPSHARSLSSGVSDVSSFESPDKSVFSLDPNETPPVVPPRVPRPYLSSTPLPDKADNNVREPSSSFVDQTDSKVRSQWVPERARKMFSQPLNSAGHRTTTSMISDIAAKVTPQPRFLSDPSGETRSPANRRRDHVRPGNISDPQARISYGGGLSYTRGGVSDTSSQASVLSEESPSRQSQNWSENECQTGPISPPSVVAFAQKGILVSDAELAEEESWPGVASVAFNSDKTANKSAFSSDVRASPITQLYETSSISADVEIPDLKTSAKERVQSNLEKIAGTETCNQTDKKETQSQRKTSFLANQIAVEQTPILANQNSEDCHRRLSRNFSDTGFDEPSGSADISSDQKTTFQEDVVVPTPAPETQTYPQKSAPEMMLAQAQNDSNRMKKQFLLASGEETFNGRIEPKVRERILHQRKMSGPNDLSVNRNLPESLRKEFRREHRTKSHSDALEETDSVITSSTLEDSLDNNENSENVFNPSKNAKRSLTQTFVPNSTTRFVNSETVPEQCIDDADEHLAGSSQSQFRIAKYRFLRKQDEMRASQRSSSTRPNIPSKNNSSIRLRIAKSTENISNSSNSNSSNISYNNIKNSTNNGGDSRYAGLGGFAGNDKQSVRKVSSGVVEENFRDNRYNISTVQPVSSNITRQFSKSAANISDLTTSSCDITQEDSGLGLGGEGSTGLGVRTERGGASCEEITSPMGLKSGGLNESKNSLFSNSRTMSSDDDLSASAVTGCTGASQGFLSRSASLDNLLADFDGDQVQNALYKIQDMLERERGELKDLLTNLFEQNQSDCEQIVAVIQQNGRETDVKRFNRYLESLCTSCKLAVHEESRLTKLDSRMTELASRSSSNLNSTHESTTSTSTTTQRSQKSIDKEIEHIRRTCEKQKVKVAEAISAFEDAETTLLQHLDKVLRNAPEDLQTSRTKIESRIEITRKICLSESNIKSNEEIEKILKKQLSNSSSGS